MRLYVFPLHPNSARVLAVLYELGIECEVISLDIFAGETRTPEFLAVNPMGTVPALKHRDLLLWEGRAIMNYLATLNSASGLCPTEPKIRARIDQWLFWQALKLYPPMDRLVTECVVNPAMGKPTDAATAELAMAAIVDLLPVIELGLDGKEGLAGPVTVADFDLAVLLSQRGAAKIDLAAFPNITRWINAMETKPSLQRAIAPAKAAFAK